MPSAERIARASAVWCCRYHRYGSANAGTTRVSPIVAAPTYLRILIMTRLAPRQRSVVRHSQAHCQFVCPTRYAFTKVHSGEVGERSSSGVKNCPLDGTRAREVAP